MRPQEAPNRLLSEKHITPSAHVRVSKSTVRETFPFHWHDFYEMEFVEVGEGEHVLNGTAYPIKRGSMFLLSPSDFHSVIPQPGITIRLFNIKFSEMILTDAMRKLLFSIEGHIKFEFDDEDFQIINQEFTRLYDEHMQNRLGKEMMIRGGVERLILELIRRNNPDKHQVLDQPKTHSINKALSYIHQHFSEPLTLEMLAKQTNMSVSYCSEFFHKETGCSFRHYLQNHRLQVAMSLTVSSNLSITEICYASGFNSVPHFHRAFKQKYGQSPSVLRKNSEKVATGK